MIAKCFCQHCNDAIEFDATELVEGNSIVPCPHCGLQTKLSIPQPGLEKLVESSTIAWSYVLCFLIPIAGFFFGVYLMAKKKSGHGAACMAISIVLGLSWIAVFSHGFPSFDKQEMTLKTLNAEAARQKPDENLRPVQGAYGWNLGDVLPNNLVVRTNGVDGSVVYGIDSSEIRLGVLSLTEERRIASILIDVNSDQREAIAETLKKKYGFRNTYYLTSTIHNSYFGATNRQVIMITFDTDVGKTTSLEYRDETLCKIAAEQGARRQAAATAAAKKQIEANLKTHL